MAIEVDYIVIERMTQNITPKMRQFAHQNFGSPQFLEDWLSGIGAFKHVNAQPFTAEFLWKQLIRLLPMGDADELGADPWP